MNLFKYNDPGHFLILGKVGRTDLTGANLNVKFSVSYELHDDTLFKIHFEIIYKWFKKICNGSRVSCR